MLPMSRARLSARAPANSITPSARMATNAIQNPIAFKPVCHRSLVPSIRELPVDASMSYLLRTMCSIFSSSTIPTNKAKVAIKSHRNQRWASLSNIALKTSYEVSGENGFNDGNISLFEKYRKLDDALIGVLIIAVGLAAAHSIYKAFHD